MAIYKDLTVLFTLLVIKAPLVLHVAEHGLANFVQVFAKYLLSPTMLASYAYLYMVVKVANSGSPVQLSERDRRVATWFLLNGKWHEFLNFGIFINV